MSSVNRRQGWRPVTGCLQAQKVLSVYRYSCLLKPPRSVGAKMPRFREVVPVDDYVLDVLMRDIVGHDGQPAGYLVYLYLYGQAARRKWKPVPASLRTLAEATGLSKSAVQSALQNLRRRKLIVTTSDRVTAVPQHRVLRHWRGQKRNDSLMAPTARRVD